MTSPVGSSVPGDTEEGDARKAALDELTRLSQEAGMYDDLAPTGDTTPISYEAVEAFRDGALLELEESIVRAGLAAAAPLLVSAEAERPSEAERDLARYVLMLEQSVEGLRAELAERTRERNAARGSLDRIMEALGFDSGPVDRWLKAIAALRAAGGQEKPNGALAFEDIACAACGAVGEFHHIPAAPVGGQAEPSDAQIDADLALDGFDPKDRYPEHGHDALRTAYRSGWESAGVAAAVSGEHRNQDGKTHQGPPENCRECAYEDGAYL